MTVHRDWRSYSHEGGFYLIRDVVDDNGKFAGHCEYAVRSSKGISWRACAEGVEFADIAPLARLAD